MMNPTKNYCQQRACSTNSNLECLEVTKNLDLSAQHQKLEGTTVQTVTYSSLFKKSLKASTINQEAMKCIANRR